MAESNPTQVILTDDGIKIIKAQNTANKAATGVTDLNNPNLMSVIEKQNNIVQFAGLTSQYNVLVQDAKDEGIDTVAVTTAYNNLNKFMAGILADPNHDSDIDRATYKKYQNTYNEELAKIQNALQNSANNKFTSAANATSQAASTASQAFSQAQSAFDKANSTASAFGPVKQSADSAVANALSAQSSASSAVKQASSAAADSKDAKQIAGAVRQSYKTLTDGSTMTIAELQNGLGAKLTKKDLDGYATQNWAQNQIKLTADGINGTMSSIKSTVDGQTTDINDLKADSKGFKEQFTTVTDAVGKHSKDIGTLQASSKELSSNFDSLSTANGKNEHNISQLQQNAKGFSSTLETVQTQVQNSAVGTNLLKGTSNTQDYTVSGSGWTSGSQSSNGTNASIPCTPGASYTYSAIVKSTTYGCYLELQFLDSGKNYIKNSDTVPGKDIGFLKTTAVAPKNAAFMRAYMVLNDPSDSQTVVFNSEKLEKGSLATDWCANPADNATVTAMSSISQTVKKIQTTVRGKADTSQVTQLSNDIGLRVKKDDLISQINLQAKNTLISSGGQLTLSGKTIYFDSANPVIIPSANIDKLLTRKKITAADISANTFSTNNGTFVVDKSGAITAKNMTLNGGKLYSSTINAGVINGSTINGTTFNAGSIINNANNTAKYHSMTITPDGAYKSTYFDSAIGLQSSVESGAISYKYRSMASNGKSGQYLAYDSVINGQGFESQSGYTSAKDTTFSNTETITGYVNVTPSLGIYLYGPTQKINFAGNSDNIGSDGITMDSYGNLYGQNTSAYWRIGDSDRKRVADFGLDKKSGHQIIFSRNTSIGNLFLGVGHTIGMLDKKPLYFKRGDSRGNMLDIKAGAVHYTSLVKSSLLSVKKDVKRVDTAYWSQLVNSIDLATYQYKSDDNTSHIRLSSIVDDVNDTKQWRLPDVFVSRDENGKLTGVDDSVLLNATLATVQEQQKEIDQLNGHNMELEARLNKLEAKLNG